MVGARDPDLSDKFDKLSKESSPYETMIGKDIGRSFPGVEMFKEAGGEGQSMLAMVLKVFSLYDTDIGYCQGLGFLVGPLLMQMGEKESFCVLVKLMEKYDLRSCFMPDLGGLHLRIFQFQRLLTQHMPTLSEHLAGMQVEAAYLSQWFLSFFAVTCPLPMLFRIYDVILAEGASETIMRVAMSLMKKNEQKLMKHTEFEEIMQLLLGRDLWEVYNFDPEELVNDFVGLTGIVTHDVLSQLDKEFRQAKDGENAEPVVRNGFFPDVSSAASRFLGRLWISHGASKSQANATLAPAPPPSAHKSGFLRRSPSKQSVSISINSNESSSESSNISTITSTSDATTISEESSPDEPSAKTETVSKPDTSSVIAVNNGAASKEDRDLHGQIEDLLTAIAEIQRDQAVMTAELQKEREERGEDHKVMQELVNRIKTEDTSVSINASPHVSRHRQTISVPNFNTLSPSACAVSDELSQVVDRINERLAIHKDLRRSSMFETKARLRESLMRSKNQLSVESAHSQQLARRLEDQERETGSVRHQLADARAQVQQGMKERQRLEQIITDMRAYQRSSIASTWSEADDPPVPLNRSDSIGSLKRFSVSSVTSLSSSPKTPTSSGLRELKLARRGSTTIPQHSTNLSLVSAGLQTSTAPVPARGSSLATKDILATKDHIPATEDQMLVDLVAAKTAEATARQELEEMKGRMESMRKMLSQPNTPAATPAAIVIPDPINVSINGHKIAASEGQAQTVAGAQVTETPAKKSGGLFSRSTTQDSSSSLTPPSSGPASATTAPTGSAWFPWARRTVSTTNATIPEEKNAK